MKIAFINPPFLPGFSREQRSPGVSASRTLYYPIWLAYAAGWAEKNGFDIDLIDFVPLSEADQNNCLSELFAFFPDLVVVAVSAPSLKNDIAFASKIKSRLPKAYVVFVGPHASAVPEEILSLSKVIDAVAVGEYDQTIVEVANKIRTSQGKTWKVSPSTFQVGELARRGLGKVDGLVFRRGSQLIRTRPRRLIANLDRLPWVTDIYARFLKPENYFFAAADYPMAMIITGRGCPFGCFFCSWPQTLHGLKYRARSAQSVAEEILSLPKRLPEIKEVVIEDDTFTADRARVQEICRLLIEGGNKLKWSANVRVGLDLRTMGLMRKAGCRLLIVGYESGSQEILDAMGKKIKLADSLKFAANAKKAGLLVHGCFMIGNPGETKETAKETFRFAKKLDPDSAQFYPLVVYPGTKAFDWAKKEGFLTTSDFNQWLDKNGSPQCLISLPDLSASEITAFCRRAYWRFHLRPGYLWKKLKQAICEPEEGRRSLRALWRWLRR